MATSKLLKPTNVTISIPEFTDQPDQRVNSNCIDKEADAINSLSEQIGNLEGVAIPSGANLNNYTTVGKYYCSSSTIAGTITNKPFNAISNFSLTVENLGGGMIHQTIKDQYYHSVSYRVYNNSSWTGWYSGNQAIGGYSGNQTVETLKTNVVSSGTAINYFNDSTYGVSGWVMVLAHVSDDKSFRIIEVFGSTKRIHMATTNGGTSWTVTTIP